MGAMDGWVTIGTELDNKQLEKDLKEAEKELAKFQKQQEKLLKEKGKVETDISGYEKEIAEYDKLTQKAKEYKSKINELRAEKSKMLKENPSLAVGQDTPEFSSVKQQISETQDELRKVNKKIIEQAPNVDKVAEKYEKTKDKLNDINNSLKENQYNQSLVSDKVSETNQKLKQSKGFSDVNEQVKNLSTKTSEIIGKVAKWTLAIFSVRSAYSALTKFSGTLARYNKQYASDLEYIQYAIAQTLAPILQYVVQLAFKLLNCINYIANAWFGVNLFAKSSAKSFENASNSLGSASKSAKELNKSLSGFDTANVLSDSSSSDTSSSGGSFVAPSVDLSNLQDVEVPEWLKKFTEFCKPIIEFFEKIIEKYGPVAGGIIIIVGALTGLLIIKSIIDLIKNLGKHVTGISADFTGFLNGLRKGGTGNCYSWRFSIGNKSSN